MSDHWERPRRRLRHLHSIQARNLQGFEVENTAGSAFYAALWSHTKQTPEQQGATCLYITEQVTGTVAPEWLHLNLSASPADPSQLHGLHSGCIHVHVYKVQQPTVHKVQLQSNSEAHSKPRLEGPAHPAATPDSYTVGNGSSSLEDDMSREADSGDHGGVGEDEGKGGPGQTALSQSLKIADSSQGPGDCETIDEGGTSEAGPRSSLDRRKPGDELARLNSASAPAVHMSVSAVDQPVPEACLEPAETCMRVDAPGDLLLAVSVDLNALDSIGSDLKALDGAPRCPMLVFGMAAGEFLVWPPLPEKWKQPVAPLQEAPGSTAAADSVDQEEDKAWRLGSLFRIPTFGSTNDAIDQRKSAEDLTYPPLDATRPGLPPKPSFGSDSESDSSFRLRSDLSSSSYPPTASANVKEATGEWLQAAMQQLSEAQEKRRAVQAESGSIMHRLDKALRQREKARQQQAAIGEMREKAKWCRDMSTQARQQAQAAAMRAAAVRELIAAQGGALTTALSSLGALWEHLEGPEAAYWAALREEWREVHRHLVARKCRLAVELQRIFGIGPRSVSIVEAPAEGFLWHKMDSAWCEVSVMAPSKPLPAEPSIPELQMPSNGTSSSIASALGTSESTYDQPGSDLSIPGSQIREVPQLAIGSLGLEPTFSRSKSEALATIGWESDQQKEVRTAAALGYAATVTHHLAAYLGIPLKYPILLANSHSSILDYRPPINRAAEAPGPTKLSLFPEGVDRTRSSYAVFLLNKDVEQLLNAHGFTSVGPSHVLQNLYKLLAAASSAVTPRPHWD